MKKVRLALVGANGKMGREICNLLFQHPQLELAIAIAKDKNLFAKKTLKSVVELEKNKNDFDLIIDFTVAEAFVKVMNTAVKIKKPILSGTTGLSKKDFELLKKSAKIIPVFWAPNMSIGVAFVDQLIKSLSKISKYDFQMIEFHHCQKKDKPSGTAKLLQESLDTATQKSNPPPLAVRGGGIYGVHQIFAMSEFDVIKIEHSALSRKVFAEGALCIASWLASKKHGLYNMTDYLNQLGE